MKNRYFKKAFTLLELVFVIVILGIVSSIGSQIIVQVYEGYIMQRAVHDASVKTELAINQIANRLSYRIDKSMIARKAGNTGIIIDTDIYPAGEVPFDKASTYPILEWIGYDNDSFIWEATNNSRAGWSGFADLGSTNTKFESIYSPGSGLNNIKSIINHYTGTANGTGGAIIFLGNSAYKDDGAGTIVDYKAPCMYRNDGCISPVSVSGKKLTFVTGIGNRANGQMVYTEFYQYATSAFAVVPDAAPHPLYVGGPNVWDLKLYYGYQPWNAAAGVNNYSTGTNAVLLKNVSVFRFSKELNSIRIKICVLEQIGEADQISICKEKAVIR